MRFPVCPWPRAAGVYSSALAVLACALIFAAGASADTTIGFDDLPNATVLSTQYASSGVSFGVDNQGGSNLSGTVFANAAAHSAPNLVAIGHLPEAGVPHSDFWASFFAPQSHVSLYVGDVSDIGAAATHDVQIDAYGTGPNPIASATVTVNKDERVDKLLSVHTQGNSISTIHIFDVREADGTRTGNLAIDDLSFGTEAPPPPTTLKTVEGASLGGYVIGHFGDLPSTATIDWGDGTPIDQGTITPSPSGGYDVRAPSRGHRYVDPGTYHATVTASTASGQQVSHLAIDVADARLIMSGTLGGDPLIAGKLASVYVATFSDAGIARHFGADFDHYENEYKARIDWGDGSSSDGIIWSPDGPGQPWAIFGDHTYAAVGDYTVTVTLRDAGGASATSTATAHVGSTPPPAPCQQAYGGPGTVTPSSALQTPDGGLTQSLTFDVQNPASSSREMMGFNLTASSCWVYSGGADNPLQWTTQAPVVVNGAFVLYPVSDAHPPSLVVDASTGDISATASGPQSSTQYEIAVKNADGTLSVYGRIDLAATPLALRQSGAPDVASYGTFGPSPRGPQFAGHGITGGEIKMSTGGSGYGAEQIVTTLVAHLPAPGDFSSTPSGGGAPTGAITYTFPVPDSSGTDNQCQTSGGCDANGGGAGYTDPQCVIHPRVCSGPPKLVAPDASTSAGARGRDTDSVTFDTSGGHYHLEFQDLYLGGLHISDAFIDYNPDQDLWTGGGDLQIGGFELHAAPPPPDYGFGIHGNGQFAYGGAALTAPGLVCRCSPA
jgi:hypothetical protein